jgi:hypothetical protein
MGAQSRSNEAARPVGYTDIPFASIGLFKKITKPSDPNQAPITGAGLFPSIVWPHHSFRKSF